MDEHLSFARKSTVREYAESIGVAVAVALLLRAFVVEAFQIPSGSMIPTLEVGDHIFVSKFFYGLSIPFTDIKILQYGQPAARRRDRLQVPAATTAPTTSSAWSACRATPSRCGRRQLYVNGQRGPPRARAARPATTARCRSGERPTSTTASSGSRRWATRSTRRSSSRRTARSDFAADGGPAGRRVRDGRQPRQLLRLARVGHGRPGPDQGARADRLVVARQLDAAGTPAPGSRPSAGAASSPSSARRAAGRSPDAGRRRVRPRCRRPSERRGSRGCG